MHDLAAFTKAWDQLHETIIHEKLPPLPKQRKTQASFCQSVGFCVCSCSAGQRLKTFVVAGVKPKMRTMTLKGSHLRQYLDEGRLCAFFEPSPGDGFWLHLSHVNLTTWEAVCFRMEIATDPLEVAAAAALDRTALQVQWDVDDAGMVRWWEIWESPVAEGYVTSRTM